ncbi:hypothetical protein H9P43_003950 [Blastocladiella emersonii ATCC 22665]|nr:hypothetical protein H9P43_003950 [Blastocladiella emersonii ATCC 22665]
MRSTEVWADRLLDREGTPQPVHALVWTADGSRLLAAVGGQILVYAAADGKLLDTLRAHKDVIYSLAAAAAGNQLASAGADKTVVIWNVTATNAADDPAATLRSPKDGRAAAKAAAGGLVKPAGADSGDANGAGEVQITFSPSVKFTHTDSVQCLAYNPVTGVLCSGTASDFGLWSPESRAVTKFKISSKVTCCSWSSDGQFLALGLYSGTVSLRNKLGEETGTIDRGSAPIWALQWSPTARSRLMANTSVDAQRTGGATAVKDSPAKKGQPALKPAASSNGADETLVITDWQQTVSVYRPTGKQVGRERATGADGDPIGLSHFYQGGYAAVAGTSGTVALWAVGGGGETTARIGALVERPDTWIWSVAMNPASNLLAWATQDGVVGVHHVLFHTVHALHRNRYVFRTGLTDVVVQHFDAAGETRQCRLPCREHVKKVAVYHDKVALQLPSRVVVYEMVADGAQAALGGGGAGAAGMGGLTSMLAAILLDQPGSGSGDVGAAGTHQQAGGKPALVYRIRDKIDLALECNLLVIASRHILFCIERTLKMYDFSGKQEREWQLDSMIRYIKVVGGPPGREAVLLGMRDGWTYQVFLDNPFPVPLVRHGFPVRCVDINRTRTRLAVVDDSETCAVYDLLGAGGSSSSGGSSGPTAVLRSPSPAGGGAAMRGAGLELVYQEPNAASVAWNTDHDDLLCFSGRDMVTIKAGSYPPLQQPHQGFVVGFKGAQLFSLHQYTMSVLDVPLATCLYQYVERKEWHRAFMVACLGACTDRDWDALGGAALEDLQFDLARRCYARVQNHRMLTHIASLAAQYAATVGNGNNNGNTAAAAAARDLVRANVLAVRGNFAAAADLYVGRGQPARAVAMYTDLMMFEYALRLARENGLPEDSILKHKAALLKDRNDYEAAADTYLQVGDLAQAVRLLVQNGAVERLALVVQASGDKMDAATLAQCAAFFRQRGKTEHVSGVLRRLGDWKALVQLHVAGDDFDAAFAVAREHRLEPLVELPYAQYLLLRDDFAGAQACFARAGRMDLSLQLVRKMLDNALAQECYLDAARCAWRLAMVHRACLPVATPADELAGEHRDHLAAFHLHNTRADVLYAFHHVAQYVGDPFTSLPLPTLLAMARFLAAHIHRPEWVPGVPRETVAYALVRLARECGAPRLTLDAARIAAEFCLPPAWQGTVDVLRLLAMADLGGLAGSSAGIGVAAPAPASPTKPGTAVAGGMVKAAAVANGGPQLTLPPMPAAEEEMQPICYACSATNPLLFASGDPRCVACAAPFVFAFHSFDPLPLIEFRVADPAGDLALVGTATAKTGASSASGEEEDPMLQYLSVHGGTGTGAATGPVLVDRETLARFPRAQVHVVPTGETDVASVPARLFYRALPDVAVATCPGCARAFHADELEYLNVVQGGCPICRHDALAEVGADKL